MVSGCPTNFLQRINDVDSGHLVLSNCLSDNSTFLPVTDVSTGIVYKNEYCTACNLVENPIVAWQPRLGCTSNVYDQLGSSPTSETITSILESDPDIFQRECRSCLYQPPPTVQPPRACFPTINRCMNKSRLELESGRNISTEAYKTLVDQCESGFHDLHGTMYSDFETIGRYVITYPVYQNLACAECNAANSVACFSDRITRVGVPHQCIPLIEHTTNTLPVQTTTAPMVPESMSSQPTTTGTPQVPASFDFLNKILKFLNITHFGSQDQQVNELTDRPLGNLDDRITQDGNSGIPFTISLSNLGRDQVLIQVDSVEVNITLSCPKGQAPVGLECRDTLCPDGYISTGGRCFFHFGNAQSHSDDNSTFQPTNESGSGFFLDCPTELVLLNDSDFTQLTNSTVLVHSLEVEILEYSEEGKPLVCPKNATITEVFMRSLFIYPPGYLELTYIGCSLSAIGCVLLLITYGLFKELRTLPTKILMNLAFAILVVDLLLLIGGPVSQAFPIIEICTTVAMCLHFFFLAQFVWMSVMSFEMVRKFHQARKMTLDTKKLKKQLLIVYTLLGWGVPLIITSTTIVVNFTTSGLILYGVQGDGSLGSCWINHVLSAIVAFVAPLVFVVLFNLLMFVVVTIYIIIASRHQNKLSRSSGDKIPFVRLNVAIFITTPLPWIFGFIAILIGTTWAWYPFIIFNSSQGFVIFVAFLLTKRTLNLYRVLFLCGKEDKVNKPNASGSTVQTSQPSQNGK